MTETLQSSSVCHTPILTLAHAAELLLTRAVQQSVVLVCVAGSFWVTTPKIAIKAHAGRNASPVLLQQHDSLDYLLTSNAALKKLPPTPATTAKMAILRVPYLGSKCTPKARNSRRLLPNCTKSLCSSSELNHLYAFWP